MVFLLDKLDSKSDTTVKEVFDVFKEHFVYYFKQLVLGGDAVVKLVKVSKEIKGLMNFNSKIHLNK